MKNIEIYIVIIVVGFPYKDSWKNINFYTNK